VGLFRIITSWRMRPATPDDLQQAFDDERGEVLYQEFGTNLPDDEDDAQ